MQIHRIQSEILGKLMYNPKLTFSKLQSKHLTSKHFNYHIQELVKKKLIEKTSKGYSLTVKGKKYVATIDEANLKVETQPKVSVAIFVERESKQGELEILLCRRLKEPYYGKVGGITGKVRFGERLVDAAKRELQEETGLTGDFQLTNVVRKLAYSDKAKQECHQDQFMIFFRVTEPKGLLKRKIPDQENFWYPYNKVEDRDDLFNTFLGFLDRTRSGVMENFELEVVAEGF